MNQRNKWREKRGNSFGGWIEGKFYLRNYLWFLGVSLIQRFSQKTFGGKITSEDSKIIFLVNKDYAKNLKSSLSIQKHFFLKWPIQWGKRPWKTSETKFFWNKIRIFFPKKIKFCSSRILVDKNGGEDCIERRNLPFCAICRFWA